MTGFCMKYNKNFRITKSGFKGTVMQINQSLKYIIALSQIKNTEIFAFIAMLVFKLLSRRVLFINRKDNRNC